ncbi:Uncharacterised protein [Legionella steigerwaltii]|uniref:Uncharacterized protein n=1 Tax=Legionella steigerwaltii TaxID=460 RepID=A0A378LBH9_9GAMM|nr:DUF5630 domain-containing protein [Legionella steigerwaltii]KTD77779.1 hypothetical protein Lstg_2136 [Legionella steigerwaltii]STY23089.1 Uncharacterised protein [Legionella steigerwaltii]
MKLAKFLELNAQEKNQQIKILSLKKRLDPIFFNQVIKNLDHELLFKLALTNPEIDKICKSPELKSHWEDVWRLCGVNPKEHAEQNGKPIHEYQAMCTVPSCFDLLKGLYLYEIYRTTFKDKKHTNEFYQDAEEYLAASGLNGCFFALNVLCQGGLNLLEQEFDEEIARKTILYAQVAAKYYLSAGYLLLGNTYQELLRYQNQSILVGLNLRLLSFQALSVAKRLEQYSDPMLNNAYQGKTLSEASNGQISNLSQALLRSQKFLVLSPLEIEIATTEAKTEAALIQKTYNLEKTLAEASVSSAPSAILGK